MPDDTTIQVTIDPSLLEHFTENLAREKSAIPPEVAITNLLATILDNSPYPIRARQIGKREVRMSYHIRSFSQPIFE